MKCFIDFTKIKLLWLSFVVVSCVEEEGYLLQTGNLECAGNFDEEIIQIITRNEMNSILSPILFVGSSSIKRWENLENLSAKGNIVNNGFGGSTMCDLLNYMTPLVVEPNPSKIFVYEGDNDISEFIAPETIGNQMNNFVDSVLNINPQVKIFILSPKPSYKRWKDRDNYYRLMDLYKNLSVKRNLVYVDLWNPMLDAKTGEIRHEFYEEDSTHVNQLGYEFWEVIIKKYR